MLRSQCGCRSSSQFPFTGGLIDLSRNIFDDEIINDDLIQLIYVAYIGNGRMR